MNTQPILRSLPMRYVFPFDAKGHFDLMLLVRHAATYLRRNLAAIALLVLLAPLTGQSLWAWPPSPPTLWSMLLSVAITPFGLMASVCACILIDLKPPRD